MLQVTAQHVQVLVTATGKFTVNLSELPPSCKAGGHEADSVQCRLKDISTFTQELLFSLVPSGRAAEKSQVTFTLQFTDAAKQSHSENTVTLDLNASGVPTKNSQKVLGVLCRMNVDELVRRNAIEEAKARASLCPDPNLRQTIERDESLPDEERLSKVSLMDKRRFAEASAWTSEVKEVVRVVVPRHSLYPVRRSTTLQTLMDGQTEAWIRVYEGEDPYPVGNHRIGDFTLTGIPPGPAGSADIKVTFAIDDNGILTALWRRFGDCSLPVRAAEVPGSRSCRFERS